MNILNLFRRPSALKALAPKEVAIHIEQSPKPVIVDVRSSLEYSSGHIAGAEHYALGNEANVIREVDKSSPVILICKTGHRSQAAAHTLLKNGFTDLYHLEGGMNRWRKEGFPEVK